MNKLPRDIILIISKMHPLIIPPFTNKTLSRAVVDYLNVKIMYRMFDDATSFNQRSTMGSDGFEKVLIVSAAVSRQGGLGWF